MATEIVEIKNRWTGEVIFSAEVGVTSDMGPGFKLGLAARLAVKKRANLAGANLADAKNIKLPPFQIPQEGELIVWKKLAGGKLCKLRIPPDARRTASVVGRKCRAEFAEVLEGNGISWRPEGHAVTYAPGKTVRPDGYDDNPLVECAQGIHFFLTRDEAEALGA